MTFNEHTAPVTGLDFVGGSSGKNHVVVSCSLDGTVRAFDLIRYRNFRTMTTPTPVQFLCVAADPSGEVVCAGTLEPFDIYVWSLQTAKLLDVLSGHEGPVAGLAFSPTSGTLASASWDRTVKVWDVFNAGTATETLLHECVRAHVWLGGGGGWGDVTSRSVSFRFVSFRFVSFRFVYHSADVLSVAYRPDGRQLCTSSRDGKLSFWNTQHATLEKVINGRKDAVGGRKVGDRRTAESSAAGKCFTRQVVTKERRCGLCLGVRSRRQLTFFLLLCVCVSVDVW